MSNASVADLCRLTVVAPHGRADFAIPNGVAIGALLPVLVKQNDPMLHEATGSTGRWVLQRLGEAPLDDRGTPSTLGLRDGDTLYLRAKGVELPPIDFDDVVDGVGTAIQQRRDHWRAPLTRLAFRLFGGSGMLVVFLGLLQPGPLLPRAIISLVFAALLVAASGACSRAFGAADLAVVLGLAALPFAGASGFLFPGAIVELVAGPGANQAMIGASVLAAGAVGCAFALGVMFLVAVSRPVFLAATASLAAVVLAGLLAVLTPLGGFQVAAVLAVLAYLLSALGPRVAARLARVRLPQLPARARDLGDDVEPLPGQVVIAKAHAAGDYLAALLIAAGAVSAGSVIVLSTGAHWDATVLLGVLGAAFLLRGRALTSVWQRVSVLVPGAVALAALTVSWSARLPMSGRLVLLAAVWLIGGALGIVAGRIAARRLLPIWGRLADIGETLLTVAMLPLLGSVVELFAWARALAG
ncbi:type VII secretion integral membrane protein EccD [Saccharopolyspora sp. 5N708]|uniref:type VII secretion integral membrane protein EccD n=1 Tax=Saccharopolyspora sp. 5N708 TaxID=3457424 RepID=UPI003FD4C436